MIPYPPILRVAITLVAFFLAETACKWRCEEKQNLCPNNGTSLFWRASLHVMVQNTCKYDIKLKYMQICYLYAMNWKFEVWEFCKSWVFVGVVLDALAFKKGLVLPLGSSEGWWHSWIWLRLAGTRAFELHHTWIFLQLCSWFGGSFHMCIRVRVVLYM